MTIRGLLHASARQLAAQPAQVLNPLSPRVFSRGAGWLAGHLPPVGIGDGPARSVRFGLYGSLKYGSSLLAALGMAAALIGLRQLWLLPLAGLAFYLVEVQLLFLFPLLLDGVSNPLRRSVRATYHVGLLRALTWTLCIAGYMLVGLLDWRQPWRKWHIGCLAVFNWYDAEVRAWARRPL